MAHAKDIADQNAQAVPFVLENGTCTVLCTHENVTETIVKEATCTEDGEKAGICDRGGEIISTDVVPALGHAYGEGVVTKEPTFEEK